MSLFYLPNGKNFDLNNITAGIRIDDKNEFLKKYDGNNNSIFDVDELDKFKEDLKPYAEDGKIDKEEYTDWYAKIMGMTVDAVKQLFKTGEKSEEGIEELFTTSFESLEEAEAHKECIDIIRNTALKANIDIMLEDRSSITKLAEWYRNLVNDKLSTNQIYRIIFEELMTADLLYEAEKGELTKSEYIERKIENTKALCMAKIMKENLEDVKEWTEKYGISNWNEEKFIRYMDAYLTTNLHNMVRQAAEQADGNMDFEAAAKSINMWVDYVLSMDEEKSKEYFTNICTGAIETELQNSTNRNHFDGVIVQKGIIPTLSFDDTEKLSFDQVFKLERGEDYSVENFKEYKKAESNMKIVSGAYNKLSVTLNDIESLMQEYKDARINYEMLGEDFNYTSKTPDAKKRIPNMLKMFAKYYMGDAEIAAEDLNKIIKDKDIVSGLRITADEDGSLRIDFDETLDTDIKRNDALNNLLEVFKSEISKRFEKVLNGKKLDDYINEFAAARDKAIGGTDLDAVISAYQGKNATVIDRAAGVGTTTGMVLTVVGGILCLTPIAATGIPEGMAALGGNLVIGTMALEYEAKYLEFAEKFFKGEEIDDEELKDLNKHFIMDAGGMIVGIKAGKMGNKVFGKLLDKRLAEIFNKPLSEVNRIKDFKTIIKDKTLLKNLLKSFGGKVSTDFLISYAGDLAMMGVLDVEGEDYLTLLRSNLMGIAIGTASDLSDLGSIGIKRERWKELRDKQAKGVKLDDVELKELFDLEKEFAETPKMGLTEKPDEEIKEGVKEGVKEAKNKEVEKTTKDESTDLRKGVDTKTGKKEYTEQDLRDVLSQLNEIHAETIGKKGAVYYRENEIEGFVKLFERDPELVMSLLQEQLNAAGSDGTTNLHPIQISKLIKLKEQYPEAFSKMPIRTSDGKIRAEVASAEAFIKAYEINPDLTMELVNTVANGTLRFGDYNDLLKIVKACDENPDLIEAVRAKCINAKGVEEYTYDYPQLRMLFIQKMAGNNFDVLASLRTEDGKYCLFSGSTISNIRTYMRNIDITEYINDLNNPAKAEGARKQLMVIGAIADYSAVIKRPYSLINNMKIQNYIMQKIPEGTYNLQVGEFYADGCYEIRLMTNNGPKTIRFQYDETAGTIKEISTETRVSDNGTKSTYRTEFSDGTVIVESYTYDKVKSDGRKGNVIAQKRETYKDGVLISTEEFKPSNVSNKAVDIGGNNQHTETRTYGTNSPSTKYVRDIRTADGKSIKTEIVDGPKGGQSTFTIEDADGKQIINITRKRRQIDENHYKTETNGQKYDIKFEDNKITVVKEGPNGEVLDTVVLDADTLDPRLINLYKQLPGEIFFAMQKMGLKIRLSKSPAEANGARFSKDGNTKEIIISPELMDNPFIFMHEFGHAMDHLVLGDLCNDPVLRRILEEEIQEMFSRSTGSDGKIIDYFTSKNIDKREDRLQEVIAEVHALISGKQTDTLILRGIKLAQNLPRSVEYITNKMMEAYGI